MITTLSRTLLVSLAVGAAVVAGTGAASADTTPPGPLPGAGSVGTIFGGGSASLSGSYSGFMNSFGSATGLAATVYPINPMLATLVCIFGGSGSQYTPPNAAYGGVAGCNSDLNL